MKYHVRHGDPRRASADCIVVGIQERHRLGPAAKQIDQATRGALKDILAEGDFEGTAGQTLMLRGIARTGTPRLLLAGLGKREGNNGDNTFRKSAASIAQAVCESAARSVVIAMDDLVTPGRDIAWRIRQMVQAIEQARYVFDEMKSDKPRRPRLREVTLLVGEDTSLTLAQHALDEARAISTGMTLARDLANLPGNVCTPSRLAEEALKLAAGDARLKATVLEEKDMEKLGMGALLGVSRGSREPAKLIVLEYRGGKPGAKPVALVGKGLTFDAGGISIKSADKMDEMKFDMCGGASVLGALHAVKTLRLPVNVVGVIPSSENLPDGNAYKPGDILTTLSGQTVEVLNTDAEGRLILCDALTYTERFEPEIVIDIATLTGAVIIALGHHASGLLGNDQPLVDALLAAGQYSGDRAWQLPLWPEYQEQLRSNFADFSNVGGRPAGTITGAAFLARFARKFRWAHLDIAGTAWKSDRDKGATGRPVPLLVQYLIDRCAPK